MTVRFICPAVEGRERFNCYCAGRQTCSMHAWRERSCAACSFLQWCGRVSVYWRDSLDLDPNACADHPPRYTRDMYTPRPACIKKMSEPAIHERACHARPFTTTHTSPTLSSHPPCLHSHRPLLAALCAYLTARIRLIRRSSSASSASSSPACRRPSSQHGQVKATCI